MSELDDLRSKIRQPQAQTFYVSSPATKYLEHWLLNEVQLKPEFSAYMWAAKYAKLLAEDNNPEERYTVRRLKQCEEQVLRSLFETLDFKNAHKRQILEYLASLKEDQVLPEARELSEAEAENVRLAKLDTEGPQFTITPQQAALRLFQDVNCYSSVFADGSLVVMGTGKNLEVWGLDAGQQQCINTMTGHTHNISCCMAFRRSHSKVIGRRSASGGSSILTPTASSSSASAAELDESILVGWYALSGADDNTVHTR